MKTKLFLVILLFIGNSLLAQELSEVKIDNSPMDVAYYPKDAAKRMFTDSEKEKMNLTPQMRVLYSRPALRGRKIFGELVKYGKKWRAGANESTEIMFYKDVVIGGKEVAAGRYSITIVPSEFTWMVHFNSSTDEWGSYSHKAELDVAVVKVPVMTNHAKIEYLSMLFYSPNNDKVVYLKIGWDTSVVEIPITVP